MNLINSIVARNVEPDHTENNIGNPDSFSFSASNSIVGPGSYRGLNQKFTVTVTISTVGKFGAVAGNTASYVTTLVA